IYPQARGPRPKKPLPEDASGLRMMRDSHASQCADCTAIPTRTLERKGMAWVSRTVVRALSDTWQAAWHPSSPSDPCDTIVIDTPERPLYARARKPVLCLQMVRAGTQQSKKG